MASDRAPDGDGRRRVVGADGAPSGAVLASVERAGEPLGDLNMLRGAAYEASQRGR